MAKTRKEMNPNYFWDLSSMFKSDEDFNTMYSKVKEEVKNFEPNELDTIEILTTTLNKYEEISKNLENLYVYANMKLHEDGNISKYQGYASQVEALSVEFGTATSFIMATIPLFSDDFAKKALNCDKLANYKFMIEDLLRGKKHTLSKEVENILASSRTMSEAPSNVYSMLVDTDATFGTIVNEEGETVELTSGNFIMFLQSKDRDLRKRAYEQYYSFYQEHKNTTSMLYASKVKNNIFYSTTKKYNSSLEGVLFNLNIDKSVYTNLIETVHKYLPHFHKYLQKRKEILGVDKLKFYDMYVSLVGDMDKKVDYEFAKKEVLESVEILGDDYVKYSNMAFNEKWIDVYENKGKRGGAYSWGSYIGHPYILLNYTDTLDDMFTLAHELGHALHSYYSNETQQYMDAGYTIFLAEIASTFNESILMDSLLEKTTDGKYEKYLINHFLEQFRGTVFRQTMFAEFELKAHELAEKGEALTTETLSNLYKELLELYFGDEVDVDDFIIYEWSRIPHFYESFYVYQYATGFSAALAFNKLVKEGGKEALEKYKELLKSGGKDYSLELLKKAGVDMSKPEPVSLALDKFVELVDKF